MKLYKFNKYFHRQGDIEGVFIAEPKQINDLIGSNVYFGEALGKHSNVGCVIREQDIKQLDVLDSTVDDLLKVIGTDISGYNPLNYLLEPDEE
jgi:hypothetical protein